MKNTLGDFNFMIGIYVKRRKFDSCEKNNEKYPTAQRENFNFVKTIWSFL